MKRYTQGVSFDGAVILEDGKKLTIEEILSKLNNCNDFFETKKNISISEEEKKELKISNVSEYEIDFNLGFKKMNIYNYKDGDFSIRLEDENDVVEVILNCRQAEIIKNFLNSES